MSIDNRIINQIIDFKYKLENGKLRHDMLTGYMYETDGNPYTFTIRLPGNYVMSEAVERANVLLREQGFTNVICSFDKLEKLYASTSGVASGVASEECNVTILILKIYVYYI